MIMGLNNRIVFADTGIQERPGAYGTENFGKSLTNKVFPDIIVTVNRLTCHREYGSDRDLDPPVDISCIREFA